MENEVRGVEAGKNAMVVIQASDGEVFWRQSQQKCVDGVTGKKRGIKDDSWVFVLNKWYHLLRWEAWGGIG